MKHFFIITILVVAFTFLLHTGLTDIGLLPKQASLQAVEIDKLFSVHIWFISALFSLIMVILSYSLIIFRRKKGESGDGAYISGNGKLEILWTMIPLFLVLYLAYLGGQSLGVVRQVDTTAIVVRVTAGQWFWKFEYQDLGRHLVDLIPAGRTPGRFADDKSRRHSFFLGAGISSQAGHCAGADQ